MTEQRQRKGGGGGGWSDWAQASHWQAGLQEDDLWDSSSFWARKVPASGVSQRRGGWKAGEGWLGKIPVSLHPGWLGWILDKPGQTRARSQDHLGAPGYMPGAMCPLPAESGCFPVSTSLTFIPGFLPSFHRFSLPRHSSLQFRQLTAQQNVGRQTLVSVCPFCVCERVPKCLLPTSFCSSHTSTARMLLLL